MPGNFQVNRSVMCMSLLTTIPRTQHGVSKNRGTPKSSILVGLSLINHPFWGFSPYIQFPSSYFSSSPLMVVKSHLAASIRLMDVDARHLQAVCPLFTGFHTFQVQDFFRQQSFG